MYHKGYKVWVACDGKPLPEFQVQTEGEGKTSTCFIPSESGKNFVIHWLDGVRENALSLTFKLDGKSLGHGSFCQTGASGQRTGVRVSADVEHPFQFATLQTTDDDSLLTGFNNINNAELGTIEVSLKRVHSQGTRTAYVPETFDSVGAVHERSKKAGAHSVSLGKGTRIGAPHQYLTRHTAINPSEGYVATFIFHYRPGALLQAQGIMPQSHPQDQADSSQSGVKKEKKRVHESDEPPAKRPKVEPGAAKVNLGVIDLSDDEEDFDVSQSRLRAARNAARVKKEPVGLALGGDPGGVIDLTLDDD
ncbi:hypothetical protein C8Q80DRAFT_1138446 [Daedaleopsis nitida]|nr:hypothetical protein C8Q80DRAFT_1138446 [Daedaleopsis nitida]